MVVAKTQMERFAEDLLRHCFTQDASLVDESGKISRDYLIGKTDSTVTDAPPLIMTITTLTSVRMVGGASLHRFAPRRVRQSIAIAFPPTTAVASLELLVSWMAGFKIVLKKFLVRQIDLLIATNNPTKSLSIPPRFLIFLK